MTSSLEISGKKMHNIRYASEQTGYSRDYITRLAREEKIVASQIDRQWLVDLDSLGRYSSMMAVEQNLRKQQLSDERKRELQLNELIEEKEVSRTHYKRRSATHAKILAVGVLSVGLLTGLALEQVSSVSLPLNRQMASVPFVQWLKGSESVLATPPAKEIVPTPAGAEVVNFSHEAFRLSTMAEPTDGILLLPTTPNGSSSADVKKLFSDDVKIFSDENGQQYVAQVDAQGGIVRKIPFVVVPVSTQKMP